MTFMYAHTHSRVCVCNLSTCKTMISNVGFKQTETLNNMRISAIQ